MKDLQQDTCTEAVRALQAKAVSTQQDYPKQQSVQRSTVSASTPINTPINSREDFNKEVDGKPCYLWNWGKDCGFQGSHGFPPDNLLHIWAWCAYKFKRQLLHKEQDCLRKRCFLNKKASASSNNNSTVSLKQSIDQPNDNVIPPQSSTNNNSLLSEINDDINITEQEEHSSNSFIGHNPVQSVNMSSVAKSTDVTKQPDPLTVNDIDLSHHTDVINMIIDFSDNISAASDLTQPEMVFDWFSTDSNIALTLSTEFFSSNNIPPPSPLTFKNTLLQF